MSSFMFSFFGFEKNEIFFFLFWPAPCRHVGGGWRVVVGRNRFSVEYFTLESADETDRYALQYTDHRSELVETVTFSWLVSICCMVTYRGRRRVVQLLVVIFSNICTFLTQWTGIQWTNDRSCNPYLPHSFVQAKFSEDVTTFIRLHVLNWYRQ